MRTERVTWNDRALDTETWVLAAKSAIFIVFSSRQGKNFLIVLFCVQLPYTIIMTSGQWQISFTFLYKLQKEMQSSNFTNRPGNSLKRKRQPHREIPSQNARGTVTTRRGGERAKHRGASAFGNIF